MCPGRTKCPHSGCRELPHRLPARDPRTGGVCSFFAGSLGLCSSGPEVTVCGNDILVAGKLEMKRRLRSSGVGEGWRPPWGWARKPCEKPVRPRGAQQLGLVGEASPRR